MTSSGTVSSRAAWRVQRASPESGTKPVKIGQGGIFCESHRGQVQQPRTDDAATPPQLRNLSEVQLVAQVFPQFG